MIAFKQNIREHGSIDSPNSIAAMIGASITGDGVSDSSRTASTGQRRSVSRWMAALLLIGPLSLSAGLLYHHVGGNLTSRTEVHAECAIDDNEAIEGLISLIRGKTDAELRQTADAIFRIRRARRNCNAGFSALAESDYRALRQISAKN